MIQSISAAIIFDELSSYKTKQSVAYVVGISILILGVFRLSNRHVNKDSGKLAELSKKMVEDVPDEERIHLLRKTPDRLWRKVSWTQKKKQQLSEHNTNQHFTKHTQVRIHTHTLVAKDRLRNLRRLRAASAASISIGL